MMMADPEKEQGMDDKGRMEGVGMGMEEQKQHMMANGTRADQMEEEKEPVPLRKAIRKPAFRALLGYITTFVNVFN